MDVSFVALAFAGSVLAVTVGTLFGVPKLRERRQRKRFEEHHRQKKRRNIEHAGSPPAPAAPAAKEVG